MSEPGSSFDDDLPGPSPETAVTVAVEHRGGAMVLHVTGEIDLLTAPTLEESVTLALGEQPAILVIDLTDVGFLGPPGWRCSSPRTTWRASTARYGSSLAAACNSGPWN